jgi:hypothetical protein
MLWIKDLVVPLVTVSVTALVAPFVLRAVDEHRARRARQSQFLERVSQLLWQWRYAAIRVTYYATLDAEERFRTADDAYAADVWRILSDLRFEASRALWLSSAADYRALTQFYDRMIGVDRRISETRAIEDPIRRMVVFSEMNQEIFQDLTREIDRLIHRLAASLSLASPAARAEVDDGSVSRP